MRSDQTEALRNMFDAILILCGINLDKLIQVSWVSLSISQVSAVLALSSLPTLFHATGADLKVDGRLMNFAIL